MHFRPTNSLERYSNLFIAIVGILLAILLRYPMLDFESGDYVLYIRDWYATIQQQGFASFGTGFSNYPPLFLHFLHAISALFPSLPGVVAIKLPALAADFACAWFVYLLVRLKYESGFIPLLAFLAVLFAPTVVLNSAFWGQSDSLYTATMVAFLYFFFTRRDVLAFLALGVGFALKPLVIFLAPLLLVLLLKRRVSWTSFLLIPLVYLITIIPAWIAGRPLMDLLTIYTAQADRYGQLAMNVPNIYIWVPNDFYDIFLFTGRVWTIVISFLFVVAVIKSNARLTRPLVLQLALICALMVPYSLPQMHDRYFYPADILSIVYAFYFPRHFWVPIVTIMASLFTYISYLFDREPIPLPLVAVILLVLIVFLVWEAARAVMRQRDETPVGAMALRPPR